MDKRYETLKSALYGAKAVRGVTVDEIASALGVCNNKAISLFKDPSKLKVSELIRLTTFLKMDKAEISKAVFG